MTNEEKQLLIKDLCARLPYGVMLSTPNGNKTLLALIFSKKYNSIVEYNDYNGNENDISKWEGGDIEFVRPYLRPMSSVTEEEKEELQSLCDGIQTDDDANHFYYTTIYSDVESFRGVNSDAIDWLNENHFDYRGLIPMGLALEAPEGMYK